MSSRDALNQEQIAQMAGRLIKTYAWEVVSAQWIVERIIQRLASRAAGASDPPDLVRWVEQAASEALYKACTAPGGAVAPAARARLEQGYQDLGNYLTEAARLLHTPVAGLERTDLVQETLAAVYQRYAECRHPAQFLAWATGILYNLGRANWREHRRAAADINSRPARRARHRTALDRDYAANPLGDQELLRVLHECLDTDEERMLALCFTFGLKRRELGIVFDRPLAHFDELGRKVRRKLRRCGSFRDLFDAPLPAGRPGEQAKEPVSRASAVETRRARLRAWIWEAPSMERAATPEYARYQALLPGVLAGTLAPQDGDYRWFLAYLEQCAPCEAEYEERVAALEAAHTAWATPPGDPASPLPFPPRDPGEQRAVAEDRAPWDVPPPGAGDRALRFPRYDLSFLHEDLAT